jgi:hypothetical protein
MLRPAQDLGTGQSENIENARLQHVPVIHVARHRAQHAAPLPENF